MKTFPVRRLVLGLFSLSVLSHCLLPGPDAARATAVKKTAVLQTVGPTQPVSGKGIRLRIRILPPPSPAHPEHLHLYVDGRMVLMTTLTGPVLTTVLPPLSPGRHEVIVVEADLLTHREKGGEEDSSMGGMGDMGGMPHMTGMGGMNKEHSAHKHAALARLILIVRGSRP